MRTSDNECASGNTWYIPHHGVYHPRKLQVVVDCSARYKNTSLNGVWQILHTIWLECYEDLDNTLWLSYMYVIWKRCSTSSVMKQTDISYESYCEEWKLWCKAKMYRMKMHLFAAASSPECANYRLKYLAKSQEELHPATLFFVQSNFYVDDGLISANLSLCAPIVDCIYIHLFPSTRTWWILSLNRREPKMSKTLTFKQTIVKGLSGTLKMVYFASKLLARRHLLQTLMLSIVALIFDPLGFLSPFTLHRKVIVQIMCQENTGLNDPLPAERLLEWETLNLDLNSP